MDVADVLLKISGDSEGAETAVTGLKARLAELHDQRIEVNLDDTDAKLKLDELKVKLDDLHDRTIDVHVDDTGGGSVDSSISGWQKLGLVVATVGPQILGALGQATVGALALGVATGGAASAFGVLGYAVKQAWSGTTAGAKEARSAVADVKKDFTAALGPGVQQVLLGIVTVLHTVAGSLGGLKGPFLELGTAIRAALSDPATLAGVKSLIAGFGEIVRESAPLVGPVLRGLISFGEILENIAKAAMPVLVGVTKEFVGWLGKIAESTGNTDRLRAQIERLVAEFVLVVKDVIAFGKALEPLFQSAAGFQPLIGAVIGLTGGFVKLLVSLGPVGRLFAGGLGLAILAGRFSNLSTTIGLASKAFVFLASAAIGPLLTLFPGLVTAFWAVNGAVDAGVAGIAGFAPAILAALAAVAPFVAGVAAIVAAVVLIIKFHKQLEAAVSAAWDWIKDHIKTIMEAILVICTGGFGLIVVAFLQFHKQIEAAVEAAWKLVESIVSGAWKLIEKAVSAGISEVVKLVTTLPALVLKGLGDIGSFLFHAGEQLVEGFIHGIESMFGAVLGVAGNLISSLGGGVLHLLGIHSPSTVAHGWGQMVGQGLANGLLSQRATVAAAAKQLAGAAILGAGQVKLSAAQLNLSASIGGAIPAAVGAASSGGVTIGDIHVHSNALVQGTPAEKSQIAAAVVDAIRRNTPGTVRR